MTALSQLQLERDGLEQVRRAAEVGAHLEEQSVVSWIDAATGEIGDAPGGVGGEGSGSKRDPTAGGRLSLGDVEHMGGDRRQLAHRPIRSSGLTGAGRSSRPVAFRNAATTAAGTTTVEGSPTPLAPYGKPGSGSSMISEITGGISRMVGTR